jgi:ferritin-like metal-binding protein YciE
LNTARRSARHSEPAIDLPSNGRRVAESSPSAKVACQEPASLFHRLVPSGQTARDGAPSPDDDQHPIKRKGHRAMGLFSRDIKTLDDLFVHTLRDMYYAENQIAKTLPDMIEKATAPQLKRGFKAHLDETQNHIARLDEVFRMRGIEIEGVDCPALDGILEEADDVAGEVDDKAVMDAALIAAAQAVEHYEITRYGSLIAWANQLGRNNIASVLQKTLDEEKATDKKLTEMAESAVNLRAAS